MQRPHTGSDHTLGACMAKGKFHTQWQWAELTGGGWGWSGKGLHLRNCGRGADSLFWPGSTNSGNLSSSDSGVGGGASLIKAPRRQKSSRRFQAAFLIYFGWVPIKGGRRGCMEVSSASKLCAQPLLVGSSPLGKALAPDELPPPSLLYFYTC